MDFSPSNIPDISPTFDQLADISVTFSSISESVKVQKTLTQNAPRWTEFHSSFRPRRTCVRLQCGTSCRRFLDSTCTSSVPSLSQTASAATAATISADQSTLKHRGPTAWHSRNTRHLYTHSVTLFRITITKKSRKMTKPFCNKNMTGHKYNSEKTIKTTEHSVGPQCGTVCHPFCVIKAAQRTRQKTAKNLPFSTVMNIIRCLCGSSEIMAPSTIGLPYLFT